MKNKISVLHLASTAVMILGLISTILLFKYSSVEEENIPLLVTFMVLTILFELGGSLTFLINKLPFSKTIRNCLDAISVVFSEIVLFALIVGRVNYVAFFFSGDILGTGLCLFLLTSAFFFVVNIIMSIVTICVDSKSKKGVAENE